VKSSVEPIFSFFAPLASRTRTRATGAVPSCVPGK
jgi:hypothetical protein